MDERSLQKLEYFKILDRLRDAADSTTGKERCLELRPSESIFEIRRWQKETEEAFSYLVMKNKPPFGGMKDIRMALSRTKLARGLPMGEPPQIADSIHAEQQRKAYGQREKDTTYYECLDPIFNGLAPISGVEKEITRCILSEEEMSDNASAKLSSIRKEIHITQERVRSQLQSMIHSNTYKTAPGCRDHHAQWAVLRPRKSGVPGKYQRNGPRSVGKRFYTVCRTHGRGTAQQSIDRALQRGTAGDSPDFAGVEPPRWAASGRIGGGL